MTRSPGGGVKRIGGGPPRKWPPPKPRIADAVVRDGTEVFMAPSEVLDAAKVLVYGARNDSYGHPFDDFSRTALMLTGLLRDKLREGAVVEPEDVAQIMICVKMSRLRQTPDHHDSLVDIAGYVETNAMVCAERARRKAKK